MFQLLITVTLLLTISNAERHHRLENSHISGGTKTNIKGIPYQASIEYKGRYICGAVIIGPDILLTAAHCLTDTGPGNYQIRAGSTFRGVGGKVFQLKHFVQHNGYGLLNSNMLKFSFDFGVIWINGKFKYDKTIMPIKLPSKEDCSIEGAIGLVSGWGKIWSLGTKSKELRVAKVSIWNQEKCQKAFLKNKVDDEMICAAGDGTGSCTGDSGGPLVVDGKLCGIVSWGESCGDPKFPGVYTRVTYFLDWLYMTISSNHEWN